RDWLVSRLPINYLRLTSLENSQQLRECRLSEVRSSFHHTYKGKSDFRSHFQRRLVGVFNDLRISMRRLRPRFGAYLPDGRAARVQEMRQALRANDLRSLCSNEWNDKRTFGCSDRKRRRPAVGSHP